MNKYNLCTGYVDVDELEEIANEEAVVGGVFTALACAISGLTLIIATEAACPTKACTGHCK